MAQQIINLGTAADARDGDTFRAGGQKINDNFTEVFGLVGADDAVYVSEEADFPTQDATTITLEANTPYIIADSFSTDKNFIAQNGASLDGRSSDAKTITFTGSGSMFSGTDVSFFIRDISLVPGATNKVFDFVDTVGSIRRFTSINARVLGGAKFGDFTDMLVVELTNTSGAGMTQGIEFFGTDGAFFSINRFALSSTNVSFIGIKLGTATAPSIELEDLFFSAPSGAFGISGLANNGNVDAGRIAKVESSTFTGGMTALQNITIDDVRWLFRDNTPIPDSQPDAMVSLTGSATETTISAANTPVKAAGTFVVERESQFTSDTTGKIIYDGERDLVTPIDITTTISAVSGTNKDITVYLALNGTVITNSGKSNRVGAADPRNTSVLWQLSMSTNDFLEIWVENNTDTINLIVEDAILRVR